MVSTSKLVRKIKSVFEEDKGLIPMEGVGAVVKGLGGVVIVLFLTALVVGIFGDSITDMAENNTLANDLIDTLNQYVPLMFTMAIILAVVAIVGYLMGVF